MKQKIILNNHEKGGVDNMVEIKCKHCGYKWVTNSEMMMVSCPSCLKKTPNILSSEIHNEKH